jgi:DNA gyrase subunit A
MNASFLVGFPCFGFVIYSIILAKYLALEQRLIVASTTAQSSLIEDSASTFTLSSYAKALNQLLISVSLHRFSMASHASIFILLSILALSWNNGDSLLINRNFFKPYNLYGGESFTGHSSMLMKPRNEILIRGGLRSPSKLLVKQQRAMDERGFENADGNISSLELTDEVKSSFMSYALSTILGRALPDVRDGLKPVHRRVLYAMYILNLLPSSPFRKSARVVGEVLGKYHPHGDQSVYDALVRMAQDFVMIQPLVLGHGNFGSIDDDPPAAMRYTESKLSHVAFDTLMADINDDCIDFVPNFDGSEVEPKILPSKLPLLLINGASGIAVGMATNIPPHNLREVVDGLLALIKNPRLSDDKLMELIPAPDFPTGGKIVGYSGSRKLYLSGNGGIVIRAKVHVETSNHVSKSQQKLSRTLIVVTEIPYMVNKALFLSKIADLVNEKKLEGISDIRDESDRDGIRVVIELKRDASADVVINNLYKKTQLQTSFSGNLMAIVNDGMQPKRLTLRNVLEEFLNFRFSTIRRRTQHRLDKAERRLHLVDGLLNALKTVDAIISLIRKASTTADAKSSMMSKFSFSGEQADAILGMKLGRLSSIEEKTLLKEQNDLMETVSEYKNVLSNEGKVYEMISNELIELRDKYGQPRKTEILRDENLFFKEEDLISNERYTCAEACHRIIDIFMFFF